MLPAGCGGPDRGPSVNAAVSYFEALGITEVVEAPIYGGILSRFCAVRLRAAIAASVIVNLVSHPLFSFVIVPLADRGLSPTVAVMVGEVAVCVIEAGLLFAWLRRELPLLVVASLVANACSFSVGLALL
jgi:hypothetical protein